MGDHRHRSSARPLWCSPKTSAVVGSLWRAATAALEPAVSLRARRHRCSAGGATVPARLRASEVCFAAIVRVAVAIRESFLARTDSAPAAYAFGIRIRERARVAASTAVLCVTLEICGARGARVEADDGRA